MTSSAPSIDHDALVAQAATRYREAGYEVIERPRGIDFGWVADFDPDLVARRHDEHVAIEVASRADLVRYPAIRDFTEEIERRPDWRFEFVLMPDEEPPPVPLDDLATIERQVEEVEQLSRSGHSEAALVLATAALEALLRRAARRRGVEYGRKPPRHVLGQAASLGDIDDDELHLLDDAWRVRNDVAHGFTPTEASAVAAATARVLKTARRVLSERDAD